MASPPVSTTPIEGTANHYFTAEAAEICARDIREAGEVEVFFIGRRDPSGLVVEVESHAYGSASQVPALVHLAQPGEVFIHNHPEGDLRPSNADLSIASQMGSSGVGCYIINNDCTRCRVVVRPTNPRQKVHLDEDEIAEALLPGGSLARVVGHEYEDRPQQRTMAGSIAAAFNHDGVAVVEAGTGTGKSFAYLLPAVYHAIRNQERVVVSTNTINLQEQLLHKDIPVLRAALGDDEFQVELVKGRSNYVCKRKAEYARAEAHTLLDDDFQRELVEVLNWARESPTGDRQELTVTPRPEVWDRVQSEADNCLRVRCPFYEECFFYNSRRRAARARLLIVNHSLLLSDLAVRRVTGNYTMAAVLPPYSRLILDEAHHLEEAATRNLSQQITRPGLRLILGRLYRADSGGAKGVLASLQTELEAVVQRGLMNAADEPINRLLFELMPRVADVRDSVDFLFEDFSRQFMRAVRIDGIPAGTEQRIRITPSIEKTPEWRDDCLDLLDQIASELGAFIDQNTNLLAAFEELEEPVVEALINPLLEWKAYIGRIDGLRQTVRAAMNDDRETCRWVELVRRNTGPGEILVRLCSAPVDVREILRESLHDKMKTEVLTSATLTVDRRFDFFHERVGLPGGRPERAPAALAHEEAGGVETGAPSAARLVTTTLLPTPFDYRRQVFFGVPTDVPDPRDSAFERSLIELVNRAVAASGGRAFILFTSYGQLRRVADACTPTIRRLGIDVLRQGDRPRDALLRQFREDETSVLFATASFWEGVDVKGRSLELLIIAKLPFAVPSEPIQEAQFEAIRNQGRDPFDALVVPRAVIRFKQGFGRLIRARTDRGAVLIADRRIAQMGYGRRFLRSLPDIDVRRKPMEALLGEMQFFLSGEAESGAEKRRG